MLVGEVAKIFLRFGEIYSGLSDPSDADSAPRVIVPWTGTAITLDGDPIYSVPDGEDIPEPYDVSIRNYTTGGVVALSMSSTSTNVRSAATAQAREYYDAPEATVVII